MLPASMRDSLTVFLLLLVLSLPCRAAPNLVLILADDLGFSDIEPYGSEIRTPSLTALAAEGVRFSNYHTAPSCAPSRAMLLTGVDSHRNGVPNMPEALPPEQAEHTNYQGVLAPNVVTVAALLQDAGYHTYMAGKWHLGKRPEQLPNYRGFERSVAMADTGADNWEQKPYLPIYRKANWFEDGREMRLPEDFYSSRFLVDKTIEFIDSELADGRPFFAYVPFQAVHLPVQAPQEFIDHYRGTYDDGWDALREKRRARAIELGLVPEDSAMVRMDTTEEWDRLNAAHKRYQAKRMAVYAGMVEAMDYHIGRLIEYLKARGEYDNTIFIFASDNGSEASGPVDPESLANRIVMRANGYVSDYDTLGLEGSFNSIGASFASASAAPLAYYKFYTGEGGMRVPLVIAGKPLKATKSATGALAFVTDVTPTLLDLAGVAAPDAWYGGHRVEPMIGRSLVPLIRGEAARVHDANTAVAFELGGNTALFQGDYKLVMNRGPTGDDMLHLYDIVRDPGEAVDLSAAQPKRVQSMREAYARYVTGNGVLPVPDGYRQGRQVAINGVRDRLGREILLAILALAVLVPFYLVGRRRQFR